jgi:outer membrane immunogenic protein
VFKRFSFIPFVLASLAIATPAWSADVQLPRKAVPAATVFSWTGFYVGGHAGYGWSDNDVAVSFVDPGSVASVARTVAAGAIPTRFDLDRSGFIGGGQIGYNYQFNPNWVIGVEADISFTDWKRSQTINTAVPAFFPISAFATHDTDWFGTARLRLGYAASNWLFYGTGGVAFGQNSYGYGQRTIGGPVNIAATSSSTDIGWSAGGGIEYGWSNWTVRAEYLHYDLGDQSFSVPLNINPAVSFSPTFQNKGDIVRLGVNYRFGAQP